MDWTTIALGAVILGLLLFGAVLVARRLASSQTLRRATPPLSGWDETLGAPLPAGVPSRVVGQSPQPGSTGGALLLVQSGGRVTYMSPEAREWFGLLGEEPNLERLARRTQPADSFLALCAGQSPVRFALHGRPVEGEAFSIPVDGMPATLVALRRPAQAGEAAGQSLAPVNSLAAELGRWPEVDGFACDVEITVQAISESAVRLVASMPDAREIAFWDASRKWLSPYRPPQTGEDDEGGRFGTQGRPAEALVRWPDEWEWGAAQNTTQVTQAISPYQSFVILPLQVGEERVGALALAWYNSQAYTLAEREALRLLAGSAAVALKGALQCQKEQRRQDELDALARLAAAGQAGDTQGLFTRLVQSLQTVLDVEALGFWIWDPQAGSLDAQPPFVGFSADFASLYHVGIPAGSPAVTILRSRETIVATHAVQDERLRTLGLDVQAQAADFLHTILAPLIPPRANSEVLGYLQVADRRDGTPFGEDDLRLVEALARQAAALIDAARLAQEAQFEEKRAAILSRIAGLSGARRETLLCESVQILAGQLGAQAAGVILNEEAGWRLHTDSAIGPAEAIWRVAAWLDGAAGQASQALPVSASQEETGFGAGFRPWLEASGLRSGVVAPLWGGRPVTLFDGRPVTLFDGRPVTLFDGPRLLGVLLLGSYTEKAFETDDLALADAAAQALAAVLEGAGRAVETDERLRERALWFEALAETSRELARLEDPRAILQRLYAALLQASGATCGTVLLLEEIEHGTAGPENGRQADLRAALVAGDPQEGPISALERQALESGAALTWTTLEGAGEDRDSPAHPGVQAALLAPVVNPGGPLGLIHLHWLEAGAFDPHSPAGQEILHRVQRLAGQAAGALERARRSAAQQWWADSQARLLHVASRPASGLSLQENLADLAAVMHQALPCAWVTIDELQDIPGSPFKPAASAGMASAQIVQAPLGWTEAQAELLTARREGNSYWLPQGELWLPIWEDAPTEFVGEAPAGTPGALPLGLLRSGGLAEGYRPGKQALELAEQAARLAGLALVYQRRSLALQRSSEEAQTELERARRAAETAQARLPALLRKDLESTQTIQQLSRRADWLRAGLDFAALVDRQTDRPGVYIALAGALRDRLDLDVVLVAEPSPSGPRLAYTEGALPAGANPAALLGQLNPLRPLLDPWREGPNEVRDNAQNPPAQTEVVFAELADCPEWQSSPLLRVLETHSFVCFAVPGSAPSRRSTGAPSHVVGQSPQPGSTGDPSHVVGQSPQPGSTGAFSGPTIPGSRLTGELPSFAGPGPAAAVLAVRRPRSGDRGKRRTDAQGLDGPVGELPSEAGPEARALVDLLARQTALALHNLHLEEQTGRRLQEVHTLLAFSRRLGSLDPSALLQELLQSAMELIPAAQAGWVAVWDTEMEAGGLTPGLTPQVMLGYPAAAQLRQIRFPVESLPGQSWKDNRPQRLAEVDFTAAYPLTPDDLVRYRNAAGGRLPVASLILPVGATRHVVRRAASLPRSGDRGKPAGPNQAGAPWGVLVLDNFRESGAFTAQDEALITSLAQQTALALEAARLYQAAEGRAVQLQALTEVAAKLTARLDTDGLIGSLLDLAQAVVPYDTAVLWLRGGWGGRLRSGGGGAERFTIHAAQGFEDSTRRIGLSVIASESQLLHDLTASGAGRPVVVHDVRSDSRFSALVEPRYLSWLGAPLLVGRAAEGEVIGVIALEKSQAHYYTPDHVQALATFAAQASAALNAARLYEESLARAAELDHRSNRLALLNRLSTELSGSLDATYILQLTLQELLLALNAAGGSALLFDAAGETLLQAEVPRTTPGELPVVLPEAPIFAHLRDTLGVYSIADLYDMSGGLTEPRLAPLQDYLAERGVRALLILPLATGGAGTADLHGMLLIHHPLPHSFAPEEVELARTISNQAAVAAQNGSLFQETQWLFAETRQRSAELATLFDLGVNIAQVLDRQKLIDLVFATILNLMQVESVGLVLREETQGTGETGLVAQAEERGERIGPLRLPPGGGSYSELVLQSGEPLLINDCLLWALPHNLQKREGLPPGVTIGDLARSWLGVPLIVRGAVIGVLAAQSTAPDHFHESHLRLLGQIANQLAVALDNARLFATVQSYAADLEERVSERTAQLEREHGRTQTLLGIITELSTSLDMDIVLNRTLALINETVGAEHSMIMLVLPDETTLYLRATLGYPNPVPKGGQSTGLRPDTGLAGWVITQRQPALAPDLWQDARWTGRVSLASSRTSFGPTRHEEAGPPPDPLAGLPEAAVAHRSALAVPLMMGEETLGALLLFHDQPQHFSFSQLDLVQATAKQIAVAINNAQLYTLIRDQAERLGDMLRHQHVETSRSQAILEAVADGVLVTDSQRVVTLFNASAERILDLSRESVIGKSLENFVGLFGKAGQTWMDTIRRWSEDPASIDPEEDYSHSEQIELEDLRVVSVHLSPVRLRNDFLGTVSTFRDITHQVVVDRLKSEFVATVSHELRTPMTSIKGYVEILLMGAAGELSAQQMRFLEIVRANTERLAILVNDLLDLSRIEAGRAVLSLQPVDLRQLAREAIADVERRNGQDGKGMKIELKLPTELPRIMGDAERIHQILDNLLDNAYAYTPPGGYVKLSLELQDDEVQVEVQDNGIGIHPEDQPRIFERFYRGEDPVVLATSGAGLGLSIVRHLVEMHKGRIWLQSPVNEPGESRPGSRFTFTLPVYQVEND